MRLSASARVSSSNDSACAEPADTPLFDTRASRARSPSRSRPASVADGEPAAAPAAAAERSEPPVRSWLAMLCVPMGVSIRPSASSAHALAPPVRPPHPSTDAPAAEAELGVRARRSLLDAWEAYERMEPVGLPNVGNSCYMNAALQCLLAIPQLTAYFLSGAWRDELNAANPLGSGGAVAEALARLVSDLWPAEALALEDGAVRAARTPRAAALAFKTRLEAHRADFRGARQHDAHEFGALLLDSLHEDLSRCAGPRAYVVDVECHEAAAEARTAAASWGHYLRRDRSVVVDLFQGQLRSQVRCHECAHASTRFDPTMLLSLPLPPKEPGEGGCAAAAAILFGRRRAAPTASPLSDAPAAAPSLGRDEAADGGGARSALDLADCFAELFKAEELGADNLWSCPHCKAFRPASKRLSVYRPPPVLILHLKRYAHAHGRPHATKRDDAVAFPVRSADFSPFVAAAQPAPPRYSLAAVCGHVGGLSYGHYTATVRRGRHWWELNDSSARRVPEAALYTAEAHRAAYLLFYTRDAPSTTEPRAEAAGGGAKGACAEAACAETGPGAAARDTSARSSRSQQLFDERAPAARQSISRPEDWPYDADLIPDDFARASTHPEQTPRAQGSGGNARTAEREEGASEGGRSSETARPRAAERTQPALPADLELIELAHPESPPLDGADAVSRAAAEDSSRPIRSLSRTSSRKPGQANSTGTNAVAHAMSAGSVNASTRASSQSHRHRA